MTPPPTPVTRTRWALALAGLGLFVFAAVALTGPGRIDIEDGQVRFEAGKNLIEYGDTAIRDPRVVWFRLPGRGGREFTTYRFPQELVAAGCVLLADAAGPGSEGRRHFAFSLHGAVAAALLAVVYAGWFRRRGLSPAAAVGWAAGGVFCTPVWYYATSTFDDAIGSLAVVAAVAAADAARTRGGWRVAATAALFALAFNCKQPLVVFALPAAALIDDPARPRRVRLVRLAAIGAGVAVGAGVWAAYQSWKFPPEFADARREILARDYPPNFFGNPAEALLDYAVGPSSGAVWYCPPVILMAAGLAAWAAAGRGRVAVAVAVAAAGLVGFCSLLTYYKGGVCWGPRYLTPVFAVGWLFAPAGVPAVGRRAAGAVLAAGVLVQVLGLAVVPERLYVRRAVPTGFFLVDPWLNLRPELGHLPNRLREVADAVTAPPAPEFTPGPAPTFAMPVFDPPYYTGSKGIEGVRRYTLLNGPRPWWATFPHLPPDLRPVPILETAVALGAVALAGLVLGALGLAGCPAAAHPREGPPRC